MSHAQLYIATSVEVAPLPEVLRTQSADVEHFVSAAFGIADARRLSLRAHRRAVSEERQFLIAFDSITVEAQNALLKLFEEPPEGVVFHIVVPRREMLLPTLQSRLLVVGTQMTQRESEHVFFTYPYDERLREIAARTKAKDVAWCEAVANAAEHVARTLADAHERRRALSSVMLVRSYLGARGASAKMLLEELALALPVVAQK